MLRRQVTDACNELNEMLNGELQLHSNDNNHIGGGGGSRIRRKRRAMKVNTFGYGTVALGSRRSLAKNAKYTQSEDAIIVHDYNESLAQRSAALNRWLNKDARDNGITLKERSNWKINEIFNMANDIGEDLADYATKKIVKGQQLHNKDIILIE